MRIKSFHNDIGLMIVFFFSFKCRQECSCQTKDKHQKSNKGARMDTVNLVREISFVIMLHPGKCGKNWNSFVLNLIKV